MCFKAIKEKLLGIKLFDDFYSANERKIITVLEKSLKTERKAREALEKNAEACEGELIKLHEDCNAAYQELSKENKLLREKVFEPSEAQLYWENKYPKTELAYPRWETDGQYSVDLRNWFQIFDKNIPTVSGKTFEAICLNALKSVKKSIKYVSDLSIYGKAEYWAYAYQVLKHRADDCDGGAVLLANIILKSIFKKWGWQGLLEHYWRVKINAGDVKGGGHLYVTVCAIDDAEEGLHPKDWKSSGFRVLDWCFWPNDLPLLERPLHREERNYFGIWFSWDFFHCYAKPTYLTRAQKKLPVVRLGRK